MPRTRNQAAVRQPDTRSSEGKTQKKAKVKNPETKGRYRETS